MQALNRRNDENGLKDFKMEVLYEKPGLEDVEFDNFLQSMGKSVTVKKNVILVISMRNNLL